MAVLAGVWASGWTACHVITTPHNPSIKKQIGPKAAYYWFGGTCSTRQLEKAGGALAALHPVTERVSFHTPARSREVRENAGILLNKGVKGQLKCYKFQKRYHGGHHGLHEPMRDPDEGRQVHVKAGWPHRFWRSSSGVRPPCGRGSKNLTYQVRSLVFAG